VTSYAAISIEQSSRGARFHGPDSGSGLERDTDCDADTRVSPVVHVVPIVSVANVNVVGFVPVACPRVWPRINKAEPIAAVLKAWESADDHVGLTEDYELMARSEMAVVMIGRNTVAIVAAALLPRAVVRLPVLRSMSLPCCLLDILLFLGVAGLLLDSLLVSLLLLRLLLVLHGLLLRLLSMLLL
jgi:hypothetical protein